LPQKGCSCALTKIKNEFHLKSEQKEMQYKVEKLIKKTKLNNQKSASIKVKKLQE
jgi:hypothetical protein